MTDRPDRDTLVELYHQKGLSANKIGERFDVSGTSIQRWMDKMGIETQKPRNKDLLADLQRVSGDNPPTQTEYREQGKYGVGTVQRRFDGWNAALEAAGYEPRTKHQSTSQEELLTALESLAEELGRSPSQSDINEYSKHSHKTFYRKFEGGLEEAKEQVGLKHYEKPSKNRITVQCENCGQDIERTPSELKDNNYNYCSQDCLSEHKQELYSGRGNPQSTLATLPCDACGEEIDRPKWKREKNERHYCSDCWGSAKVMIECEQCGETEPVWPAVAEKRRFCSTDCVGKWISEEITGEDHPRWRGGYEEYYGPNWPSQRRKAVIRDQARCQDCGMTEAESMAVFGEGLSVHHITPVREFIVDGVLDYEQANQLENLVTLCRPCHSKRETEAEYSDF